MKKIIKKPFELLQKKITNILVEKKINNRLNEYDILQKLTSLYIPQLTLPVKRNYTIAFMVTGMPRYSGGHMSILRLGTYLAIFGHKVTYIDILNTDVEILKTNAKGKLPSYEGEFLRLKDINTKYDIVIATAWITAYYINEYQRYFLYKAYFIQGYEPGFYPEGDRYHLALNTYKMNFHMISIGHWNKKRIEDVDETLHVDYIHFPYENKDYPINSREIKIKDELRLAVYIRLDEPRGSTILFQSLKLLQVKMEEIHKNVKIFFFGMPLDITLPFGINMGQLDKEELLNLYQNCHIGITASFSNISLVPYEMIAAGIPVCDFKDGSASTFFDTKSMILSESSPQSFCDNIIYYLKHNDELTQLLNTAQKNIKNYTWERSAQEFCELLNIEYKKEYDQ